MAATGSERVERMRMVRRRRLGVAFIAKQVGSMEFARKSKKSCGLNVLVTENFPSYSDTKVLLQRLFMPPARMTHSAVVQSARFQSRPTRNSAAEMTRSSAFFFSRRTSLKLALACGVSLIIKSHTTTTITMSDQSQTTSSTPSEPVLCKMGCGFFVSTLSRLFIRLETSPP